MGNIVFAGLSPHPPLIVEEVGGERINEVKNTVQSMKKLSKELATSNPDVIIFITPHAAVFQDAIAINMKPDLSGSFASFRAPEVSFKKENCLELAEEIKNNALHYGITIAPIDDDLAGKYKIDTNLDHGTMVPLYFLEKEIKTPIIIISVGLLTYKNLYKFGMSLQNAVEESNFNAAVIASGDLSHRLTLDAPEGYDEKGQEFDNKLKEYIEKKSFIDILKFSPQLIERAAECGLRPLIMLLGAFENYEIETNVFSYEGPFGVGYMVAGFEIGEKNKESLLEKFIIEKEKELEKKKNKESLPVRIARESLETYIKEGNQITPPVDIPEEFKGNAGVFVSLKKEGNLRGCIGTVEAVWPTVMEEIIHNAVSAGTRDPRFSRISSEELNELEYSVDILQPAEPVQDISKLDPKKYGVIVESGSKSGLLLPNLDGVETPEKQIVIALNKANISQKEDYKIKRFEVKRYR